MATLHRQYQLTTKYLWNHYDIFDSYIVCCIATITYLLILYGSTNLLLSIYGIAMTSMIAMLSTSSTESMISMKCYSSYSVYQDLWYLQLYYGISTNLLPDIYGIPMVSTLPWYLLGIYNFATRCLCNSYDVYDNYGIYGIYRHSQDLLMYQYTASSLFRPRVITNISLIVGHQHIRADEKGWFNINQNKCGDNSVQVVLMEHVWSWNKKNSRTGKWDSLGRWQNKIAGEQADSLSLIWVSNKRGG